MICKLAPVGCGCPAVDKNGNCTVHFKEGIERNMEKGYCVFRNIRAPKTGIYEPRMAKRVRVGQQKQRKSR